MIYSEANPFLDEIIEILRRELLTADAFVSNYIFGNLCRLARQLVPVVTTFAQCNTIISKAPIDLLLNFRLPHVVKKPFNKLLWKIADFFCWNLNQVIGETLIKNEIGEIESYLINPADKILVTVSPKLFEPKKLWDSRFVLQDI